MHRILFTIPMPDSVIQLFSQLGLGLTGPFEVHTYGALIALGVFIAIHYITSQAERAGVDPEKVTNLLFGNILWGLVGSRLLFVALEWPLYIDRPLAIVNIREGGLVFQGGVVCAFVYSVLYLRRHRLPFWKVADIIIPGIPLGHFFGRLGCFAAGCCYGTPTALRWAVTFTDPLTAGPPLLVPVHPVQLFEAGGNLLIFFALNRRLRRPDQFEGQVMLSYFLLYPVLRIGTELLRGDVTRGYVWDSFLGQAVTTSQFICGIELLIAAFFYRRRMMLHGERSADGAPMPGGVS